MNKKTYIQRAKHGKDNPYFMMLRATAQDKTLSYEARGLLAYLLSKPDHWRVEIHDLLLEKCGRDKAYRLLDELKDAGYVRREQTRNNKGLFVWGDYEVSEYPFPENPDTDKPDTDNPPQDNTDKKRVQKTHKKDCVWSADELTISETFASLTSAMVKPHEEASAKMVEQNRKEAQTLITNGVTPETLKAFYRDTYNTGYVPSSLAEIRKKIGAWQKKHAPQPTPTSNGNSYADAMATSIKQQYKEKGLMS